MEKQYKLTPPENGERKERWDETVREIKFLDKKISELHGYPPIVRDRFWRNELRDFEEKRERLVGRLHFI